MSIVRNKLSRLAGNILFLVMVFIATMLISHVFVSAQVWTQPERTPPLNNPSNQPPSSTAPFVYVVTATSTITVQTLAGSLTAPAASSVPVDLGQSYAAVSTRNSFAAAPALPGASSLGVFAYATGTIPAIYGYADGNGVSYGIWGAVDTVNGYAGKFLGPVTVSDNGVTNLGAVLVTGNVVANTGIRCITPGCTIAPNGATLLGRHTNGGYGIFATVTNAVVATTSIEVNVDDGTNENGIPVNGASTNGYGIGAFGTSGIYARSESASANRFHNGVEGYADNAGVVGLNQRKGVYGLSSGGLGSVNYSTVPVLSYDFNAGVRACVKNSLGVITNENAMYAKAPFIPPASANFAGYFDVHNVCSNDSAKTCVSDPDCGAGTCTTAGGDILIDGEISTGGGLVPRFDNNGVITGVTTSTTAFGIAKDSTYVYIVGSTQTAPSDWRIEKRLLDDASPDLLFGTNGVVISDANTSKATHVVIEAPYMYVVGTEDRALNKAFRIEKRRLDTGALCDVANCGTQFGTNGIMTEIIATKDLAAQAIAIDTTAVYVVGSYTSGATTDWRIEKYDKTTGILVPGFNSGGIITGAANTGTALDVSVDTTYMYVIGSNDTNTGWVLQKYRLDNGNICTAAACGTRFGPVGTPGEVDVGAPALIGRTISLDGTYLYIAGSQTGSVGVRDWRIEKRQMLDGTLCNGSECRGVGFGVAGVVQVTAGDTAFGSAADKKFLYVVGTTDTSGGNVDWYIGKLKLLDGTPDSNFGAAGYQTSAAGRNAAGVTVDGDGTAMYIVGDDLNAGTGAVQWRVEKRFREGISKALYFGTHYLTKRNLRALLCKAGINTSKTCP